MRSVALEYRVPDGSGSAVLLCSKKVLPRFSC